MLYFLYQIESEKYLLSISFRYKMITRGELFEEVKKNPKAYPGKTQFGLEALKILYALHHSYFESQGLLLNEDNFNANQVVIKTVKSFNKSCGERWKEFKCTKKAMFKKYEDWFNVTLDFTDEKENFFQPIMVQEPPKPVACQPKPLSAKLKEAKRIRENVSSDEVLILATTQAFRKGKKSASAFVLQAIKDDEDLAVQMRHYIKDYKEMEEKAFWQRNTRSDLKKEEEDSE